jgi:electron transfer flavoprotein beta subunit
VEVLGAEAVQADAKRIGLTGSPTQVVRTEAPQRDSTAVYIEGDASQQAHKLAELIAGLTEGARA